MTNCRRRARLSTFRLRSGTGDAVTTLRDLEMACPTSRHVRCLACRMSTSRRRAAKALAIIAALASVAAFSGLIGDARKLVAIGASLRQHHNALDGSIAAAVGSVVEHFAIRATVQAIALPILLAATSFLVVRAWGVQRSPTGASSALPR